MRVVAATVLLALAGMGVARDDPRPEAPAFTDITRDSGIAFVHENSPTTQKYLLETMGGGVALLDYDGDGNLDVFFTNGALLADPMPVGAAAAKSEPRFSNRLYRGLGGGRFADVTEAAGVAGRGYGMGAAVGDYDNDGDADLYVTAFGGNQLLRNKGDGAFDDVTAAAGVAGDGWSTSAACVDWTRTVGSTSSSAATCASPTTKPLLRKQATRLPRVLPSEQLRIRGQCPVAQRRRRAVHRCFGKRRYRGPARPFSGGGAR